MSNFEEKYRIVKRESSDGKIQVAETVDSHYALIVDGEVKAIYEHLTSAFQAFGRLIKKEE